MLVGGSCGGERSGGPPRGGLEGSYGRRWEGSRYGIKTSSSEKSRTSPPSLYFLPPTFLAAGLAVAFFGAAGAALATLATGFLAAAAFAAGLAAAFGAALAAAFGAGFAAALGAGLAAVAGFLGAGIGRHR